MNEHTNNVTHQFKPGDIITLECGQYSDHTTLCIARIRTTFNVKQIFEAMIKEGRTRLDAIDEEHTADPDDLLGYLLYNEYIEEINYDTIFFDSGMANTLNEITTIIRSIQR